MNSLASVSPKEAAAWNNFMLRYWKSSPAQRSDLMDKVMAGDISAPLGDSQNQFVDFANEVVTGRQAEPLPEMLAGNGMLFLPGWIVATEIEDAKMPAKYSNPNPPPFAQFANAPPALYPQAAYSFAGGLPQGDGSGLPSIPSEDEDFLSKLDENVRNHLVKIRGLSRNQMDQGELHIGVLSMSYLMNQMYWQMEAQHKRIQVLERAQRTVDLTTDATNKSNTGTGNNQDANHKRYNNNHTNNNNNRKRTHDDSSMNRNGLD